MAIEYLVHDNRALTDAVVATFARTSTDGSLLLSGRCPRCDHEFQAELPLTRTRMAPGRGLTGMAGGELTATPVEYLVVCACDREHPGRPSGRAGCGAMGKIAMARKS